MAIHDVYMVPVRPSGFGALEFIGQMGEIGGK
jgi:hypothetical protein